MLSSLLLGHFLAEASPFAPDEITPPAEILLPSKSQFELTVSI
jgi:hypothetical protein